MNWIFPLSISIVTYGFAVTMQRVLMKNDKSDPIIASILFQFVAGCTIFLFGLTTGQMAFQPLTALIPNLFLTTFLWTFTNVFGFYAMKYIESSKFTVITASRAFFTVLAASIFLGERLSSIQIVGGLLIFLSIVAVVIKKQKLAFSKGEFFAMLSALCMGLAIANDAFSLRYIGIYPYVTLAYLLPVILTSLLFYKRLSHLKTVVSNKKTMVKLLTMSMFYIVSSVAFFSALKTSNNASRVSLINLTSTIVIILMGIIFLKERDGILRKIIGGVISFFGALLLLL